MLSNYPAGAEHDPNAPYNQVELSPIEVGVGYSCTLAKDTYIEVSDYDYWEDKDEDGHYGGYNLEFCDIKQAFAEQVFTPLELIERLKTLCKHLKEDNGSRYYHGHDLDCLIEQCDGWQLNDVEVEKI